MENLDFKSIIHFAIFEKDSKLTVNINSRYEVRVQSTYRMIVIREQTHKIHINLQISNHTVGLWNRVLIRINFSQRYQ